MSGYVLSFTDAVLKDVRSNVGTAYAYYDEGAYRNELKRGDMRRAPEALRLVNSGLGRRTRLSRRWRSGATTAMPPQRTLRVVFNERVIAPLPAVPRRSHGQPDRLLGPRLPPRQRSVEPRPDLVLEGAAGADCARGGPGRPGSAGAVASPAAGLPDAGAPCSRSAAAVRRASGAPCSGPFVAGAVIACVTYIPLSELSQKIFVAASNREPTWFFPQRMNNAVMLWAFLNGLVGVPAVLPGPPLHPEKPRGRGPSMWGAGHGLPNWRKPLRWRPSSSWRTTGCSSRSTRASTSTTGSSSWASASSSPSCCSCWRCTRRSFCRSSSRTRSV